MFDDTIAAIASASGGGVGVIRSTGNGSLNILLSIFRFAGKKPLRSAFVSHKLLYGKIYDSVSRETIDDVYVVFMRGPKTYTGEDVFEIFCHGSSPVLRRILSVVVKAGARLAEKGEFTKRAFLNNKIDLLQAESVLDLVSAKTDIGAASAYSQLKGELSVRITKIVNNLKAVLAQIEVEIDFSDDVGETDRRKLKANIRSINNEIVSLLKTYDYGRILRDGALVAIVGRPNVGKSSLYNALLKDARAIVTDEAGTTRDTLEEGINIHGIPLRIVDTAGLRDARSRAEAAGISKAERLAEHADLILLVVDASVPDNIIDSEIAAKYSCKKVIVVYNKIDASNRRNFSHLTSLIGRNNSVKVSSIFGHGVKQLERKIIKVLAGSRFFDQRECCVNERHRDCLIRGSRALSRALIAVDQQEPQDIVSIPIKEAIEAIGEMKGDTVTEEILSKIFSDFCVGK